MTLIIPKPVRGRDLSVHVKRPGERRSLSRSATRALDVLQLFGAERRPLRAVEVARALAIHSSTTNQLLKTMVDSAHLMFDARDKTYLPTPRLASFSGWLIMTYGQTARFPPLLEDLQLRTGMIVTISAANDLFMQIIDLGTSAVHGGERGMRVSLFGSAIGSAYLSMLEDGEVRRLADRARIPIDQLPEILNDVARIRREGFADGAITGDTFWSIAMPLPICRTHVPMVLGLAGLPGHVRQRRTDLLDMMRAAIDRWMVAATLPG